MNVIKKDEFKLKLIERIDNLMKINDVSNVKLSVDLSLAKNIVSEWKRGRIKPSIETIVDLSNYFKVSTDWLLTGKEASANNTVHTNTGNIGVVGQVNAPVTVQNGEANRELTDEEIELLRIYNILDFKKRVKFLNVAIELEDAMKTNK